MRWWNIVAPVIMGSLATIASAADIQGQGSGFSMYKARILADVLPYDVSSRAETHRAMRRLGQLSLNPLFNQIVDEIETDTFPEWPRLVLVDNDNDKVADYFNYYSDEGPSDLYGTFFSLVDDGPPAWVVFPVGPFLDDNKEFLFLFTHWVDQNSDGKLDLIIQEDVDLNGSGEPEAGTTAWLADDDFDGLIDTAMHCVQLRCSEITAKNGVFDLKLVIHQREGVVFKAGQAFSAGSLLDGLFGDLRRAMEKE